MLKVILGVNHNFTLIHFPGFYYFIYICLPRAFIKFRSIKMIFLNNEVQNVKITVPLKVNHNISPKSGGKPQLTTLD